MLLPKACTELAGEYTHGGVSVPDPTLDHLMFLLLFCIVGNLYLKKFLKRGGDRGDKSRFAFLTETHTLRWSENSVLLSCL